MTWKEPKLPQGIVTGCDKNHEWMLPWWYNHYTNHNMYPILFADFGMSAEMKEWCKDRGYYEKIAGTYKKNWFKKPRAIMSAPFEKVIWMDNDCEVRADVGPLFEHADKGVGVTLDPHTPHCKMSEKPVATGVIVASNGDPLIDQWAKACANTNLRGDQAVFNDIVKNDHSKLSIMPPEYQWLRLDGERDDIIMMHWTGSTGKKHIRKIVGPTAPSNSTNRSNKTVRAVRKRPATTNKSIINKVNTISKKRFNSASNFRSRRG